MAIM